MVLETGAGGRVPTTRTRRGNGVSPRLQIAELQRARLLSATVLVADELGWSDTRVAHIAARARVSRRTFYELFENREDCLLAVLQDVAERIARELVVAELAGCEWRERVRGGLFTILSFFEREPALARVCVVQALQGGSRVLVWRGDILAQLTAILDKGREDGSARSRECTTLTAEGLVGAAFAIMHARLLASKRRKPSLVSLQGELMSMIVLPYHGPAAARAERHCSLPLLPQGGEETRASALGMLAGPDPLRGIPMRLTYRTARVLDGVATHPGASNRMVADHAGITDQGQVSKLLARLERLGLLVNSGRGQAKGEPNAWTLTPTGQQIANSIAGHSDGRAAGESVMSSIHPPRRAA
jgi:AcrR family transcriptional regulator/DNA-binding MarR family transcriptional regulator